MYILRCSLNVHFSDVSSELRKIVGIGLHLAVNKNIEFCYFDVLILMEFHYNYYTGICLFWARKPGFMKRNVRPWLRGYKRMLMSNIPKIK